MLLLDAEDREPIGIESDRLAGRGGPDLAWPAEGRCEVKLHINLGSRRGRPPRHLPVEGPAGTSKRTSVPAEASSRRRISIRGSRSASRCCDHFAKSATNSPHHGLHGRRLDPATQRPAGQEVSIHSRYLLTEGDAVARKASGSGRQRDACRAEPTAREQRNDDDVIGHAVPHILGKDQGRSRLVRIVRLPGRRCEPDFPAARILHSRPPSAQLMRRWRPAAARLVAFQARRSSAGSSAVVNCTAIASS